MRTRDRVLAGLIVACGWCASLQAEALQVGRFFTDRMVMQRDKPTVIRGSANAGAAVTVAFAGQEKTAVADGAGAWSVALDPLPASLEPRAMTVRAGGETVTLSDLLVGDVFLVALQTGIDISLGRTPEGRAAAASHAPTPRFRAVSIQTLPAGHPRSDLPAAATRGWQTVGRETALRMSATAYHLGRGLTRELDVPVGIVDLNLGPAFAIGWLSREALLETERLYGRRDVARQVRRFENLVELADQGEPMPDREAVTAEVLLSYAIFPAGGYNAVLHPLRGLALKAALVQLGNDYPHAIYDELERSGTHLDRNELNRAYVQTYDIRKDGFRMAPVTVPRIPRVWRDVFGDDELPFGLILPPASDLGTLAEYHREMRELHRLTAEENPAVGLILPGMENIPFSAQPRDGAVLAERSLQWVRGAVYGLPDVSPTGPVFDRLEANYNEATIHFKAGTAIGLQARDGALAHFEAAGVEGGYSPVAAVIEGETVRIRSDVLGRIVHVRYNWNQRPEQGLVNAAGLPAIPFRSQTAPFLWLPRHADDDLPMEYTTPANEWEPSEVALISGHLKTHGYDNFTGWIGPVGIRTGPFGPNMGVREVKPGSPAEGRILVGDMIYSANGTMVGDRAWEVMAAALTESETREAGGRLVIGLRRGGRNLDVELTLPVMGSYSATAPYDCPKTERIIANLENWVVANGAGAGFLNNDALFMLATGNPELQGFVRRIVYGITEKRDPTADIDPTRAGRSWHNSAEAILLGEYFLATGDRHVLPYLKHAGDRLAATQQPGGGWRHNFPGGASYGLIPNAGLPGVMGMHFAKQAGVDIDMEGYHRAVHFYRDQQAETGFMIYGIGVRRPVPAPIDPAAMAAGRLSTFNGGLSAAGILMKLTDNHRAAHLCSFISAHAWNNTFDGHGGNFWNNFWTPLGAHAHGREAFITFWRYHRWYRESNRMFDGGLIQHENGRTGAGTGIALVAPRARLQIVGAPPPPFAADAPALLAPALAAYGAREYERSATLAGELLAGGSIGVSERPTVEALVRQAREIQASISADLARMDRWVDAGDPASARSFLGQLKGVMHPADERLAAIEQRIATARQGVPTVVVRQAEDGEGDELITATAMAAAEASADDEQVAAEPQVPRDWVCLVTEVETGRSKGGAGKVPAETANPWRMRVVEHLSQAPQGWTQPDFDDASWWTTHLPISWRMYHTVLLRTTFTVENKAAFDGLRFRAWLFRQQGVEIYLNGNLIGRINNIDGKTGNVEGDFLDSAVKYLRDGENTLAVTTRHNWRWGMLFMNVYNDGFGFRIDARKTL